MGQPLDSESTAADGIHNHGLPVVSTRTKRTPQRLPISLVLGEGIRLGWLVSSSHQPNCKTEKQTLPLCAPTGPGVPFLVAKLRSSLLCVVVLAKLSSVLPRVWADYMDGKVTVRQLHHHRKSDWTSQYSMIVTLASPRRRKNGGNRHVLSSVVQTPCSVAYTNRHMYRGVSLIHWPYRNHLYFHGTRRSPHGARQA